MTVVLYLDGDLVMQGVRKEIMTPSESEMLNEAEIVAGAVDLVICNTENKGE